MRLNAQNGHLILGAIFVFCLVAMYLLRPDNAVSVLIVPFQTTSARGIPRKAQTPPPNSTCSPVDVGWMDADSSQRYLVAYMQMHHGGNQMGNLVFELMGLVGIAKVLGRLPVIVLGSEYDHGARPQFWDNLLYYPNLYSDVRFVCDPGFNKDSYRQASFLAWDESYPVLQRVLESENDAQLFVAIIDMVQTSRYYEIMGKEDLRARLAVPELTRRFVRNLVVSQFHEAENRMCVHMRRGDFGDTHIASTSNYTAAAIREVLWKEPGNFSVTIFSDEQDFVEDMVAKHLEYEDLRSRMYLPPARTFRYPFPKHYTWAFFGSHCTHIVLTASQSTFGIIAAYTADESVKVYVSRHYTPDVNPTPMLLKHWQPLDA